MDRPLIGIGLLIWRDDKVLMGKRKEDHVWAFPGGHLEKWESFEATALRELREEAGFEIQVTTPRFLTAKNTRFYDEDRHYVVLFMQCFWQAGEAVNMEPDKLEGWEWHQWNKLPSPLMMGIEMLRNGKK